MFIFERERENERRRGRKRGRQGRLHADSRELHAGLNSQTAKSCPEPKSYVLPTEHPGAPPGPREFQHLDCPGKSPL